MMTFVLNTLVKPNGSAGMLVARLIGNTEYLVIARPNCIEIYSFQQDYQIKLERTIDLYESIIEMKCISLFGQRMFLVVVTNSNKVLIIGFESIQNEFVLEEFDFEEDRKNSFSIQPHTLIVDQRNNYIGVFTIEGLLWLCEIDESVSKLDFHVYKDQKIKKKKLFKEPVLQSFPKSGRDARTPMIVERLESYEDGTDSFVGVLYRDDLFQYYFKTFIKNDDNLTFLSNLQFKEAIKPLVINSKFGFLLFGKTGIYLKTAPDYNIASLSAVLESVVDSTIQIDNNNNKQCHIKKTLPIGNEWDISAAILSEGESDESLRIVFVTNSGEVYVSELKLDLNPIKGEVILDYWTVDKYKGRVKSTPNMICQIENDTFVTNGPSALTILKLESTSKTLKVLFELPYLPPILDFNISGTTIPKIQVCGGSALDSGYINTEFKGFNTEIRQIGSSLELNTGVLNMWVFNDHTIINSFDGVRIFKLLQNGYIEVDDFYGLNEVDGNVLDMVFSHNELLVLTEKGIFINGKLKSQVNITAGHIQANGSITYVSGNSLFHNKEKHKVSDDVSVIYALSVNRETHILVGHWEGAVDIFVNGVKKPLKKSELAISSVLIKKIGNSIYYFISDAAGNIRISDISTTVDLNIGDAPVTLVDYTEFSFLAYNAENVVKIDLDGSGNIVNRGYLSFDIPYAMKYNKVDEKLVCFTNDCLSEVKIEGELKLLKDETKLPKLVRKSVNFKNFLHLSLFVTITTRYNELLGREVWNSELRVIDNNTFKTKSIYKFDAGLEVTDVVNTEYRKELIDTYEEENIGLGMENVLSQCFVVSCAYNSQDEYGPPLMLFSVDEFGHIQYQCSCPKAKVSFQSLTNHANRLVIGAGDAVIAYKIEYSITDSKFTLKKISDSFRTKYSTSHIKSVGPDVVVGDIVEGVSKLQLKVKENTSEDDDTVFEFKEYATGFAKVHFLTAMETFQNIVITADSLKNIKFHVLSENSITCFTKFNLDDQINVIKKIDNKTLTQENLIQIFNFANVDGIDDIVPIYVLGSVNGGIYLLSIINGYDFYEILEKSQEIIVKEKHHVLGSTGSDNLESFTKFTSLKRQLGYFDQNSLGVINGDLIKTYDTGVTGQVVSSKCVLL